MQQRALDMLVDSEARSCSMVVPAWSWLREVLDGAGCPVVGGRHDESRGCVSRSAHVVPEKKRTDDPEQ